MNRMFARASLTGVAVAVLTASLVGAGGALVHADPAAAAEDEATSSAVTLTNQENALNPEGAPFPDLEVTVSQTKDLVSQGIRVSWTGGSESERPFTTTGGANFLQIAQCWGEDPEHPGHPDRRTCQYGGTLGAGSVRDGTTQAAAVADEDLRYTHLSDSFFTPTYTGIPFVAANPAGIVDEKSAPADRVVDNLTTDAGGEVVRKTGDEAVNLNTNPFFNAYTTNEVKWAGTGADGRGAVPFEVQTAVQSTALGCGTPIEQADGSVAGQPCWLVIIPRGRGDSGSAVINRSGLWWDAWEHHIAVRLEFKPIGVRCQIGESERQLAGSELIARAIASWQPDLCLGENGSPFVLSEGRESDALVKAAGVDPSPLAFTSLPLDVSRIGDGADPLAYAPVALSGVAISFSIDRQPHPQNATPEQKARAGLPLTEMKLTPRLVAKLLTTSYVDALPSGADASHLGANPRTIVQDPEFQKINGDEWSAQIIVGASVADVLTPSGRSDIAVRLWEYVLADADARAWLNGADDGHGMFVNPWYSTNADVNPIGAGLDLPLDSFPKADPSEKPDETQTDPANGTGAINLVTWRPYTSSFADSAYHVLRGDGMILGAWDKFSTPPKFGTSVRELFGSQKVMGVTTASSAELYQTVTAALLNPSGEFVAPTREAMAAAAAAMTPDPDQTQVLRFDPASDAAKAATTAYPLSMPVFAALNPRQTDADLRAVYANLIRYAATDGQSPGTDVGDLPSGYAPLPEAWVGRALAAAEAMERGSLTPPGGGNGPGPAGAPGGGNGGTVAPPSSPGTPGSGTGAPAADQPAATGAPAGELAGAATPDDPEIGAAAAAVPIGVAMGLAAGLAVPLTSRIRRRA